MITINKNNDEQLIDLDFTKLSIGDQILIINKLEALNTNYRYNDYTDEELDDNLKKELGYNNKLNINDITLSILTKKADNFLYSFKNLSTEISMNQYQFNCELEIDFEEKNSENAYIYLDKNLIFKINEFYEDNTEKYNKYIIDLIKQNKFIDIIEESKSNEINSFYIIPFKTCYLILHFNNIFNFEEIKWKKDKSIYCIDKNLSHIYSIYFNDNDFNKFFMNLNLDIPSYINAKEYYSLYTYSSRNFNFNPENIEKINEIFKNISFLNLEKLKKLFDPIYVDNNLNVSCNLDCFSIYSNKLIYNYDHKIYKEFYAEEKPYYSFRRKVFAIAEYIRDDSLINIYTGDIIRKKIELIYKDTNFLIVKHENYRDCKYYLKIDNIWVSTENEKEKKDIISRKNIAEKLSFNVI